MNSIPLNFFFFCEDHGIIQETTYPYSPKFGIIHEITSLYSPKFNGIAERKNRTLKDMMSAMLVSSRTPLNLWEDAIISACAPNIAYLKVWECLAKVLFLEPKKWKLGLKTFDVVLIGYAENSATYRFLIIKLENILAELNTIMETKNANFFENILPLKPSGEQQI